MPKYLVIVESPSKAKTIKKYLGKNYTVDASMGHIRDLPKSQLGVDVEHDFEPKYISIRGKGDVIKRLKKEVKSSDSVFLATDPDREGEAISWHLMKALNIPEEKASRVEFNEITKDAVKSAIKHPRELNLNLVDAQQARRVLDRIVGYKISPLLWRKIKKGLSAGRVQSVAMKIICDREDEISKFVSEEYWTIDAVLNHKASRKNFKAKFFGDEKGKIDIKNQEEANAIMAALEQAEFQIESIKNGRKKKNPSAPFITSTLQQEAARKLGFAAARTMRAAQQLYEGVDIKGVGAVGLITYMRTDSTRIAQEAQDAARDFIWEKWGKEYLPSAPRQYKNKKNAQDAHEAIRPSVVEYTPAMVRESLSADQYKLYKLIWERFIASQMQSAEYETVAVIIRAGAYRLKANGSTTLFPGFTVLYEEGKDLKEGEDTQELPKFQVGDELKKKKLEEKQHFTQPPARYTEASLIKTMEELGIGRPSTYAPTITTILARNYVVKDKKQLVPTELGGIVNDLMKEYFKDIVDVDFTANMEANLDKVEEGKANWVEVIRTFYNPFEKVLEEADKSIEHIEIKPEETDIPCEKCGRMMVIRESRYGKFLACPGFPQCRNTKPITVEIGVACPKCGGKILERKSQKGAKFFACENSPQCDFISWDMPTNETCPVCGKMLMKRSVRGRIIQGSMVCSNKECSYNKKKTKKEKE